MPFQLSYRHLAVAAMAAGALGAVLPPPSVNAPEVCYPGESTKYTCYTRPNGTPQDIRVSDAKYAAASLREYATYTELVLDSDGNPVMDDNGMPEEVTAYHFLNMTTATAPGCGEWTVWGDADTVLVTAKLMSTKQSGLVWLGDIADTIDGGVAGTATKEAIINCGTNGGSREVMVNTKQPAYDQYQAAYKAGTYTAGGIVVKVVQNVDWKKANPGWKTSG